VATEEFVNLALEERLGLGVPALPFSLIPHPLGGQPPAGVAARADTCIDQIVHALTTPAAQLTAEEKVQQYPRPNAAVRHRPVFG
jgi:hypothetical protein